MGGSLPAKKRALALLGEFTIFIEHHDVMVRSGLMEALSQALVEGSNDLKVRTAALSCLADLAKSGSAQGRLLSQGIAPPVLRCVLEALQGRAGWEGSADGRCHAARLLSELCSLPESRTLVVQRGLVQPLIQCSKTMPVASGGEASIHGDDGGHLLREEERYTAAALFGAAGSPEGSKELREDAAMLSTLRRWALCPDPILQRCGVGALAKVAQSGDPAGAGALAASGGVEALVAGLSNSDPQAACFAAAGVSAMARQGGAGALARQPGLPHALLAMAQAPSQVAVQRVQQRSPAIPAPALSTQSGGDQGRHPGGAGWSPGVALGVQRCGLRAMLACCQEGNPQLLGLLRKGRVVSKPLQEMVATRQVKGESLMLCRQILELLEG